MFLESDETVDESDQIHGTARALLVIDQPVLSKVVNFALNHGVFVTRVVPTSEEAVAILGNWQPHLAIMDMDICQGRLMADLKSVTLR